MGVNIQLALGEFYGEIQQAAEHRMEQITLQQVLERYHSKIEGMDT